MKRPVFFRTALLNRGRKLMRRWVNLVQEFGDGDHRTAERLYPRLTSYRKRAYRIAMRLRRTA